MIYSLAGRLACGLVLGLSLLHPLSAEERTANYFESIRGHPAELLAFLRAMPKGADLHSHVSGAVYAESFLQYASQDGLCLNQESAELSDPPCQAEQGSVPAANALADPALRDTVLDAWSMRDFQAGEESGADHFFNTFHRFALAGRGHIGDEVAELAGRAAIQNEIALELMLNADGGAAARLGAAVGWDDKLVTLRDKLLTSGMADVVAHARRALDMAEASKSIRLRCGTPSADRGCDVELHYIREVHRDLEPAQVFAEMLAGFELAVVDPRVVGINLVGAEDAPSAMADIDLHMSMLDYLHAIYPTVRISLHAGEQPPWQVTPDQACCHIRLAVERGHANRVGHGVDILSEQDPAGLLNEMATSHTPIEIMLTSNDLILGVRGVDHPLLAYLRSDVPIALATDDEGILRTDLTHEYLTAAQGFGLTYQELKTISRDSLSYSFLPGDSLWAAPDTFIPADACSGETPIPEPSTACSSFLARSERARAQWRLEIAFHDFESSY